MAFIGLVELDRLHAQDKVLNWVTMVGGKEKNVGKVPDRRRRRPFGHR
jgi:hypothetical protein